MTKAIEYGWFLPTAGDAATRLDDPTFYVPPNMEFFPNYPSKSIISKAALSPDSIAPSIPLLTVAVCSPAK